MKKLDEHYMLLEDDDVIREGDIADNCHFRWKLGPGYFPRGFLGLTLGKWNNLPPNTKYKVYRPITLGESALTQL